MTKILFFRNKEGQLTGFSCSGHSGYAREGEDVVCAGISALVINTINSIETLTDAPVSCKEDPAHAVIRLSAGEDAGEDVQLLLASLLLGLRGIEQSYGSSFIEVSFKEV